MQVSPQLRSPAFYARLFVALVLATTLVSVIQNNLKASEPSQPAAYPPLAREVVQPGKDFKVLSEGPAPPAFKLRQEDIIPARYLKDPSRHPAMQHQVAEAL